MNNQNRNQAMKAMHKLFIGATLVVALGFATFAADKPATQERVLRIQSGGQIIAEIHLLKPCKLMCGDRLTFSRTGEATYQAANSPNLSWVLLFDDGHVLHLNGNVDLAGKMHELGLQTK